MTAVQRLRCDARLGFRTSMGPVICRQVVAVHVIVDASGTVRGACSREGHAANVIRRFGQQPSACCGAGGSTPHWVYCPERLAENEARALWGDR